MTREDAFYYENLLILGFKDEYDKWLNSQLEAENELANITLDLAWCGSDVNKAISILRQYRTGAPIDDAAVCKRLRLFLKDAYDSKRMDKGQVVSALYTIACHLSDLDTYNEVISGEMILLEEYYSLAKEGILDWNSFDSSFFAYLDNGLPLDSKKIWSPLKSQKDDGITNYIRSYIKRNVFLALFCAIIVFIPFFIVSLLYNYDPNDTVLSFIPFGIALICVLLSLLPIVRFRKMIDEQEKMYNTVFSDSGAEHLETTIYLSEEWLIKAGCTALYKEHVENAESKLMTGSAGASNRIKIKTKDGKRYIIWCLSDSNLKKILSWCERLN